MLECLEISYRIHVPLKLPVYLKFLCMLLSLLPMLLNECESLTFSFTFTSPTTLTVGAFCTFPSMAFFLISPMICYLTSGCVCSSMSFSVFIAVAVTMGTSSSTFPGGILGSLQRMFSLHGHHLTFSSTACRLPTHRFHTEKLTPVRCRNWILMHFYLYFGPLPTSPLHRHHRLVRLGCKLN